MNKAIQEIIFNWVAWCWQGLTPGPYPPTRCLSMEGRFLNGSHLGMDDVPCVPLRVICVEHAKRVQAIYDAMALLTRQVVRIEYVQRRAYDCWEWKESVANDGQLSNTWVRTGNNRRTVACLKLKIDRKCYMQHVGLFRNTVRQSFDL